MAREQKVIKEITYAYIIPSKQKEKEDEVLSITRSLYEEHPNTLLRP
jgi:hypothetical protein